MTAANNAAVDYMPLLQSGVLSGGRTFWRICKSAAVCDSHFSPLACEGEKKCDLGFAKARRRKEQTLVKQC